MRQEERYLHGGRQARDDYFQRIGTSRTRTAAERVLNTPEPPTEPTALVQSVQSTAAIESSAHVQPVAVVANGAVHVATKLPFLAGVNSVLVQIAIPIVATILIGGGIGLGVASIVNNMAVQDQVKSYASEASDSGESGDSGTFVPSKDSRHPVKVEIPDLSIKANTTQVDVTSKGNVGAPASIKEMGWYDKSSSPADAIGTALIVGHVGTPTYTGALAKLYTIKKEASIKVTMADGKTHNYKVTKVEDIKADEVDMKQYLPRVGQTSKELILITCAGDYNERTYSYEDRLIVSAISTDSEQ